MKLCPACKREFSDETQFCRADGTRLIPQGALFAFQSHSATLAPSPDAPDADAPVPAAPPLLSLWSAPNAPAEPETPIEPVSSPQAEMPVAAEMPIQTETTAAPPVRKRVDGRFVAAGCALLIMLLAFWLDARQTTPQADGAPAAIVPVPSDLTVSAPSDPTDPAPPKETPASAVPPAAQPQVNPSKTLKQNEALTLESPRRRAAVSMSPRIARLPLLPLAPMPVVSSPEVPTAGFSAQPTSLPAPRPTATSSPTAARLSPPRLARSLPRPASLQSHLAPFQPAWTAPTPRVQIAPSLQSLRTPPAPTPGSTPSVETGGSRTVAATAPNRVPLLFGIGIGAYQGGPRHVVYVLDVSLSMPTRIAQAKEELRTALETLGQSETFGLVAFDKQAHPFQSGMAAVTPESIAQAQAWLDAQELGEGTNLEAALRFALGQPDVNTVVVLTDGVPTVGESNADKLARLARRLNTNRARIYTIGLVGKNPDGSDDTFEAAGLLQRLARESGGESRLTRLGDAVH